MAALETAGRPRGRSRLLRVYVAMWAVLSVVAVAYLATMVLKPELIMDHLPAMAQEDTEAAQNRRAIGRLAIEAHTLRTTLADLQRDIAEVKATVHQDSDQERMLAERLAAVEEQTRRVSETSRADIMKFAGGAETQGASAQATAATAAPVKPKVIPAPPPASAQTVVPPPLASAAIETGAIAPPISFGPAVVTPARGPVAIHLSKWPSLDAVRLAWGQLAEQHKSALNKLEPRFKAITTGGEAPSYQLLAGPVANAEEGGRICAVLRVKRVGCRVGQLEGEVL